ncbi:MAG TPA: DUF2161 domain-containing phosphodiesterase [Hyphomicrobiales bacterium]|nr:DUF2161 domain-containing phosphodiesterase [Hyphomicrobiales bacterium]
MNGIRETDLYEPVKAFLEGQGYEVKAEVGAADIVASNGVDELLIVELKTGFSLALFHQAIARQAITDAVYIAVPHGTGRRFLQSLNSNKTLCRRLGLGLLSVRLSDGHITVYLDPGPYRPRKSKPRQARLLKEFVRRVGDPNTGGSTRRGLVTAYRQDALRCVNVLKTNGPGKASEVARQSGVAAARRIMADDHYGWFERIRTGIYALSPKGVDAVAQYDDVICQLSSEITPSE